MRRRERTLLPSVRKKNVIEYAEIEENRRIFRKEMEENNKLLDAKIEKIVQLTSKLNNIHDGSPSLGMRKSNCGSVPCFDQFDGVHLPAHCELLAVDGNYKFPCAKGMDYVILYLSQRIT